MKYKIIFIWKLKSRLSADRLSSSPPNGSDESRNFRDKNTKILTGDWVLSVFTARGVNEISQYLEGACYVAISRHTLNYIKTSDIIIFKNHHINMVTPPKIVRLVHYQLLSSLLITDLC